MELFPLNDTVITLLIGILSVLSLVAPVVIVAVFPRIAIKPPAWLKPLIAYALPLVEILVGRIFNVIDEIITERAQSTPEPEDDVMWAKVRTKVDGWIENIHTDESD